MLLTYSLSYTHKPPQRTSRVFSHLAKHKRRGVPPGHKHDLNYLVLEKYETRELAPRSGHAYSLSYTRQLSQKVATIFHSLGDRVRCRFSRVSKPIDHLGGLNPEARLLLIDSSDRDLENWPKTGSTFENMDTRVY